MNTNLDEMDRKIQALQVLTKGLSIEDLCCAIFNYVESNDPVNARIVKAHSAFRTEFRSAEDTMSFIRNVALVRSAVLGRPHDRPPKHLTKEQWKEWIKRTIV